MLDRHVALLHVVREGALVALNQDAEPNAALARRPVLHEARRIAEVIPRSAADLPSRVRLKRGLPAFLTVSNGALPSQGQPNTVLLGAVQRRVVVPDVSALLTATVADLRRARAAMGRTVIGAPPEETTPRPLEGVLVGLPLPSVLSFVVEMVAPRLATATAHHPSNAVAPRPCGLTDLPSPNLRPEAAFPTSGLVGKVAGSVRHGLIDGADPSRASARLTAPRETASGAVVVGRPTTCHVGPSAAQVAKVTQETPVTATVAAVPTQERSAGETLRRQDANVVPADDPSDRPLRSLRPAVQGRADGPVNQGVPAPAVEGHRAYTTIEGAGPDLTFRTKASPATVTTRLAVHGLQAPEVVAPLTGPSAVDPVQQALTGAPKQPPLVPMAPNEALQAAVRGPRRFPTRPSERTRGRATVHQSRVSVTG